MPDLLLALNLSRFRELPTISRVVPSCRQPIWILTHRTL